MSSTSETIDGIENVLAFWFAPNTRGKWFAPDADFDEAVRRRLETLHLRAAEGALDQWRGTPRGCLALVILLDQVPRNIYRDDPRTYATDAQALDVARHALNEGFDASLSQVERLFLYMPFEHSEDMADQDRSVALIEGLDENPEWLDYAHRHRDVIARFGRFPHRNAVLGRRNTPEEARFLADHGPGW